MKKIIFLFLVFSINIFSQKNKIDSLLNNSKKQNPKNKFHTYLEISNIYIGINLDSAKVFTNKAYQISKTLKNDTLSLKALSHLGFRNFESSNYDEAINYFNKALTLSFKIKDSTFIADIYNGFAISYSKKGDFNKSVEYNFKTLSIYEKIKDSLGIGNSYLNIGWDFRLLKEFNKALEYNKKSLLVYEKIKDSIRIAMINNNIAGVYNELGNYQKAIDYASKSKEYFNKLNFKRFTAYPLSVLAVSYDSLHNYKLAEQNYLKSIELHTINKEPHELTFLNYSLGNLYYKKGNYSTAINKVQTALDFAKEADAKQYIVDIALLLSKLYEKRGKEKISNKYLKLYIKYNDSILNEEKLKSIAEIETKYETSKKEKEIAIQKELLLKQQLELKNKTLYSLLLGGALLLFGIVFFAIYKRNQLKREQLEKEINLKDALATIKTQNRLQEQRLRISRDLHDNIGAQLTFIISSLDNLNFVTKDLDKVLKDKLNSISSFTSETIQQLRDTIWAMNKTEITAQDLHSRILSFIEKAKNTGITTSFEIKNNIENNFIFSSLEGMNIFRIVQEAINNAIKYAEAKNISVYLIQEDKHISVSIKDDGNGFDVSNTQMGNGLSNMEKRASEINAKVHINSKIDKGTSIKIIL